MLSSSLKRFAYILKLGTFTTVILLALSSWSIFTAGSAFSPKVTRHTLTINGQQHNYKAAAGYLPVKNNNKLIAKIFYSAYTLNTAARRPVTFVFNGGPGSASLWLHMGSLAPVRVQSGSSEYSSNPQTWLQFTDLVFIDPVGTGYSRAADGVNEKQFFGFNQDISTIATFVNEYLKSTQRANSDVYLAGESYGGARAVGLAAELQKHHAINVAGLTLISPALNYEVLSFKPGKDSAYPLYLPTYALVAQYHKQLPAALQALDPQTLAANVKAFANGSYLDFLNGNNAITDNVIDTLSYLTGINKQWLRQHKGRITDHEFARLVLNEGGNKTGIFDARVAGVDKKGDPSHAALKTTYPKALAQYFEEELNYKNELPYHATITIADWNFGSRAADYYLNVVPTLKQLLQSNPRLKVHVVGGYYDLATPVETIKHSVPDNPRISSNYYYAGHMIYTDDAANAMFYTDSKNFYNDMKN